MDFAGVARRGAGTLVVVWGALTSVGCSGTSDGNARSACSNGTLLVLGECVEIVDASCTNPIGLFRDADEDGYGDAADAVGGCVVDGYVEQPGDCDDGAPGVRPGAPEQCNGVDDDCDGETDDDVVDREWFEDSDGDGFGDSQSTLSACAVPAGFAELPGDCDDRDEGTNPGADDVCDGVDRDCNGVIDDGAVAQCEIGDVLGCTTECGTRGGALCDGACGLGACVAPEEVCNFVDDDCDGLVDPGLSTLDRLGRSEFEQAFGAVAKDAAIVALDGAVVTLVLMVGDLVQYVVAHKFEAGTGRELAATVVAGGLGPEPGFDQRIHAVRAGDDVVVAPPATTDAFKLYLLSGETLEELGSEASGPPPSGGTWASQCLASSESGVAWGRRALGENTAVEPLPPATQNHTVVRFFSTALAGVSEHTLTEFEQNLGNRSCALAGPVGNEGLWPLAFRWRNGVRLTFLSASGGEQVGLRTVAETLGAGEEIDGLHMTAEAGGPLVVGSRVGELVSFVSYDVGDSVVETRRRADALAGVTEPIGGIVANGGRLFVAGQRTSVLAESTFDVLQTLGNGPPGVEPRGVARDGRGAVVVEVPAPDAGTEAVAVYEVGCGQDGGSDD